VGEGAKTRAVEAVPLLLSIDRSIDQSREGEGGINEDNSKKTTYVFLIFKF